MPATHPYYVLLIDDSEQILGRLCESLQYICSKNNLRFRLIRATKQGRFVVTADSNGVVAPDGTGSFDNTTYLLNQTRSSNYDFFFFTAYSPRQALPVINLSTIERLTILSDIYMPSDVEVGILGLVEAISTRRLPVNLIFASSEYQNREMVQGLLRQGKAYFIEKGSAAWDGLPYAIVTRAANFSYQYILVEEWRKRSMNAKPSPIPSPVPSPTPVSAPVTASPTASQVPPRIPAASLDKLVEPTIPAEKVAAKVTPPPAPPAAEDTTNSPNLRNRILTGVLNFPQTLIKEGVKAVTPEDKSKHETMRSRMTRLLGRRKPDE